jgi:XRE family transcriptional regulator, regulator of sulfur utilization
MKAPSLPSLLCLACSCAILAYAASAQSATPSTATPAEIAPPDLSNITPSRITPFKAGEKVTSIVIDTNQLPVTKTASGSRRDVFNGPSVTLNTFESHITTINPGQSAHPPHTHGNEEMLIVKEGKLLVTIKGVKYLAPPGSIIFYNSNDLHGTLNVDDKPTTYYVFSWYTDKTPATIPPPTAALTAVSATSTTK